MQQPSHVLTSRPLQLILASLFSLFVCALSLPVLTLVRAPLSPFFFLFCFNLLTTAAYLFMRNGHDGHGVPDLGKPVASRLRPFVHLLWSNRQSADPTQFFTPQRRSLRRDLHRRLARAALFAYPLSVLLTFLIARPFTHIEQGIDGSRDLHSPAYPLFFMIFSVLLLLRSWRFKKRGQQTLARLQRRFAEQIAAHEAQALRTGWQRVEPCDHPDYALQWLRRQPWPLWGPPAEHQALRYEVIEYQYLPKALHFWLREAQRHRIVHATHIGFSIKLKRDQAPAWAQGDWTRPHAKGSLRSEISRLLLDALYQLRADEIEAHFEPRELREPEASFHTHWGATLAALAALCLEDHALTRWLADGIGAGSTHDEHSAPEALREHFAHLLLTYFTHSAPARQLAPWARAQIRTPLAAQAALYHAGRPRLWRISHDADEPLPLRLSALQLALAQTLDAAQAEQAILHLEEQAPLPTLMLVWLSQTLQGAHPARLSLLLALLHHPFYQSVERADEVSLMTAHLCEHGQPPWAQLACLGSPIAAIQQQSVASLLERDGAAGLSAILLRHLEESLAPAQKSPLFQATEAQIVRLLHLLAAHAPSTALSQLRPLSAPLKRRFPATTTRRALEGALQQIQSRSSSRLAGALHVVEAAGPRGALSPAEDTHPAGALSPAQSDRVE